MNQSNWQRVSKERPCPICERWDWCLIAPDGSAVICPRVATGAVKQIGEAGWLHQLTDGTNWRTKTAYRRTTPVAVARPDRNDLRALARTFQDAVAPHRLEKFAGGLGVASSSLDRLAAGWCSSSAAWSFPMTDARGRVLGIRLRTDSGKKFAVKGGNEGLFIPAGLECSKTLLLPEGPTDTAAILDLGFTAVGRPNDRGGRRLLVDLIRRQKPATVVIVADRDEREQGMVAATGLAGVLTLHHRDVRVIIPPAGVKDARQWVQLGADRGDIEQAIAASNPGVHKIRSVCKIPSRSKGGLHHVHG